VVEREKGRKGRREKKEGRKHLAVLKLRTVFIKRKL
jgi:hypothetical protein